MKSSTCSAPWDFLLPFPSHLIYHLTSCIRDSLHFVRRFAPSKCVRCGTSSILLSPTIMKSSMCSAPWDFLLPFPSHLIYHLTSCIRAHDHLRVALLLQIMFAAEPVRSCYRPPKRRPHVICSMGSFFLPFSFFLYSHITSCIRDSLHFVPRFAPSKCVRCGTSSILSSPTIMKSSTCSAPWDFLLPFPFPSFVIPPALKKLLHLTPQRGIIRKHMGH